VLSKSKSPETAIGKGKEKKKDTRIRLGQTNAGRTAKSQKMCPNFRKGGIPWSLRSPWTGNGGVGEIGWEDFHRKNYSGKKSINRWSRGHSVSKRKVDKRRPEKPRSV